MTSRSGRLESRSSDASLQIQANAYSATLAMLNAIDKANSTDLEALKKVLETDKVDTPVGSIYFDKNGDAIGVGFSVYQVQNGQFVEL